MAMRTARLGKKLRHMARDLVADQNEQYFIAHATLLRALREDPHLMLWSASEAQLRALMSDAMHSR